MSSHDTDGLTVTTSPDELVVRATIDRPDRRNALNDAVIEGLCSVLAAADSGPTRVVVLRGANGTFCSGGDLQAMAGSAGGDPQVYRDGFAGLATLLERLPQTRALCVAAVEGYCLAGGLGLGAACDIVLASDDATFGLPERNVGLFPAQAIVPIARTAPEKRILEYAFTGEQFDAATAHDLGLVSRTVSAEDFDAELDDLIDSLARSSPVAIDMGKRAYYTQRGMEYQKALSHMREVIAHIAMSDATEAGIEAFLLDETPSWGTRDQ
ncbi:enoyl-CoA hydratase/isomerase family protein [Halocatena halophila]|uniref:enoyl-CoA hydratase/isomerase family protein n=1 Tax=Halocatena halophila TaxID=2814576 RepID=UPI002ED09BC5